MVFSGRETRPLRLIPRLPLHKGGLTGESGQRLPLMRELSAQLTEGETTGLVFSGRRKRRPLRPRSVPPFAQGRLMGVGENTENPGTGGAGRGSGWHPSAGTPGVPGKSV